MPFPGTCQTSILQRTSPSGADDGSTAIQHVAIRNRAIFSSYDTGVRVGELVTLCVDDVHLAEEIAIVRGKTGERPAPIGVGLRRVLLT